MYDIRTSSSDQGQGAAQGAHEEGGTPFFPDHFVKEMSVMALIFGTVIFLSTLMPMPVGEPADSLRTPAGIKPEWYFLTVFQLLKYVPKSLGLIVSFVIFPPVMMVFPFFYKWYSQYRYGRLVLHSVVAIGVMVAVFLSLLAYLGFE